MRLRTPLIALTLLACEGIGPLCACTPRFAPDAVLRGTVESATGEALAGVRLRPEVGPLPCGESNRREYADALSDSIGGFIMNVRAPADSFCIRLLARRSDSDYIEKPLSPSIRVPPRSISLDTIDVAVRFLP